MDVAFIDGKPARVDGGEGYDTLVVKGVMTVAGVPVTGIDRIVIEGGDMLDLGLEIVGFNVTMRTGAAGEITGANGSAGDDRINAGRGDTYSNGKAGADLLIGGASQNAFGYDDGNGRDTIVHFSSASISSRSTNGSRATLPISASSSRTATAR